MGVPHSDIHLVPIGQILVHLHALVSLGMLSPGMLQQEEDQRLIPLPDAIDHVVAGVDALCEPASDALIGHALALLQDRLAEVQDDVPEEAKPAKLLQTGEDLPDLGELEHQHEWLRLFRDNVEAASAVIALRRLTKPVTMLIDLVLGRLIRMTGRRYLDIVNTFVTERMEIHEVASRQKKKQANSGNPRTGAVSS